MRAAAEPLPDDPDNRRDDEVQVTRIPEGSKVGSFSCEVMEKECLMLWYHWQYRDPLFAILDYIEEVRLPEYYFPL